MNAKLEPKHDLVAVQILEREAKVGAIHVPDQVKARRAAQAGKVLAVGPGRKSEYGLFVGVTVKPGDVVLFPKNAGIAFDDEDHIRLIRDGELIATLIESPIIEVR